MFVVLVVDGRGLGWVLDDQKRMGDKSRVKSRTVLMLRRGGVLVDSHALRGLHKRG